MTWVFTGRSSKSFAILGRALGRLAHVGEENSPALAREFRS
jgi:hypothetical protein